MTVKALARRALASAFAIALAVLVGGCVNPFKPASPEAPTGAAVLENFSDPDSVIATMARAIMAQSANGRNAYSDALADSTSPSTPEFYAFHYPGVVDQFTNPPSVWDVKLERNFYDRLIQLDAGLIYTFTWEVDTTVPTGFTDETAGTAVWHWHYLLEAATTDGETSVTIAVGNADLSFARVNGRWYLTRWQDRPSVESADLLDIDHPTMGYQRLNSVSSHT